MFIENLISQPNEVEECINYLRKFENSQVPPIILYGTNTPALIITNILKKNGFAVSAYFASDEYLNDPLHKVSNVISYQNVLETYKEFILIVASSSVVEIVKRKDIFTNNKQILRTFIWDNSFDLQTSILIILN